MTTSTTQHSLTPTRLVLLAAAFLTATGNLAFFGKLTDIYAWGADNAGFLLSVTVVLGSALTLLLAVLSAVFPVRLVIGIFLVLGAVTGYFTDQFGVVIDSGMIRNAVETNAREAADLLNVRFLLRLLLLGIVPAMVVWHWPLYRASRLREARYAVQTSLGAVVVMVLCVFMFSGHYASFIREHKQVRFYMNPLYPVYSLARFLAETGTAPLASLVRVAPDAKIRMADTHHELVIMVVGETARRDRFSLNGYARNTNPELAKEDRLVSYTNITSCGTSTADSVPCMFSLGGRENFDIKTAKNTENVLDILSRIGVSILWRDNNSDSKGVASRLSAKLQYEDFKNPQKNPLCDSECRDVGMLHGLQEFIDTQKGDILIVLHQMGNHGPAYFKRYPPEFERFKPACRSAELATCTPEEINNAYDNAVLYTDYFLSRAIQLLKANTPRFETTLLYMSDHGESLGENGLYLHGMPYRLAPKEQIEIPAVLWAGESSDVDLASARALKERKNSHDAISHSLLALFETETGLLDTAKLLFVVKEPDEHPESRKLPR
ncbi:MAG: phosphoethanolamine--lipid A transferase [Rhodocyclales bacterium]|nr:phosphoethanolamine--lipid A transferase [Rhodocyclales bacterium]